MPDVELSELIKKNATLRDAEFKQDNDILFTILRHYLTGTNGWNVISKFSHDKDGRGAYLALHIVMKVLLTKTPKRHGLHI